MTVHVEITYIFYLPKDYDKLKKFEAENDLSKYRKTEDTIATRYKYVSDASVVEDALRVIQSSLE